MSEFKSVDLLEKYLSTSTKEKVIADWEKACKDTQSCLYSPTVEEYFALCDLFYSTISIDSQEFDIEFITVKSNNEHEYAIAV